MALGLFLLLLVIDQAVKFFVEATMLPGESIPLIDGIFHITYVLNPGAAFGIFPHQSWFFILAGAAMIAAFFHYYSWLQRQCGYFHYGCVALLAGAVGNLIDRTVTTAGHKGLLTPSLAALACRMQELKSEEYKTYNRAVPELHDH